MASVDVNQLSEHLLKCPICLETFNTPKILPCLHSFCQRCLGRLLKDGEDLLLCPTCRSDVALPTGGVNELPTNFFINNMLDFLTVQSCNVNPVNCSNCEEKLTAVARCGDCAEFLCEQCLAAHKRTKLTKEHEVFAIKDLQTAKDTQDRWHRPLHCLHHDREVLKYYCETCDDPVCRECLIMEHREHTYGYLKDVNNEQREQVSKLVNDTKAQMLPLMDAIGTLSSLIDHLQQRSEGLQGEISRNFAKCHEVLKEKEDELLMFIENEGRVKAKNLGLQKEELETLLARVKSGCEFSENVLKHGNDAEIMFVKKQLVQRLKDLQSTHAELEPHDDDVIDYEFDPDEFRNAIWHAGHVRTFVTVPALCYATGIGLHKAKVDLDAMFVVTTVDRQKQPHEHGGERVSVLVKPDDGESFPGIVLDNNDGTYCISYLPKVRGQHAIEVTLRGKHIRGSPFPVTVKGRIKYHQMKAAPRSFGTAGQGGGEFRMPWGVAIDNEREYVIVTDSENHRVQVFDIRGDFLFKFGTHGNKKGQFRYPKGVAFCPKGYIIVADSNNNRVQVFNEDGRHTRTFTGHKDQPLTNPHGVAYWGEKDVIAVTEHDNHRVQMFTLQGNPLMIFGTQGGDTGQFLYPHHVLWVPRGDCVVSDCVNDRVQVFNKDGEYQFHFGEEGVKPSQFDGPEGIACDDEANILVCDNHNHRVQVFDPKGGFLAQFGSFGEKVGYFKNPTGLAVTEAGDVFVVDSGNNRVQIF